MCCAMSNSYMAYAIHDSFQKRLEAQYTLCKERCHEWITLCQLRSALLWNPRTQIAQSLQGRLPSLHRLLQQGTDLRRTGKAQEGSQIDNMDTSYTYL